MAPSCAMLDAHVLLVASTGEKTLGGGTLWAGPRSSVDDRFRCKEKAAVVGWMREGTIRVDTHEIVRAPAISTLSLHLPALLRGIVTQLPCVSVKSADKDLLVLSTGHGCLYENYDSAGCYLVYDAAADALFLAPPFDCGFCFNPQILGCRPVIMRFSHEAGDFVLCLVAVSTTTRQYYLLRWSPAWPTATGQQWMCNEVCLPDGVVNYHFVTDVAFAHHRSMLGCWVDLNLGVLTCDVLSEDPTFQLKLLPEDYAMVVYDPPRGHGRRDGYSTMGCGADGKIKFLYVDGFDDITLPRDKVTVKTWTLEGQAPHFCNWQRDDHTTLSCGDLWADESFLAIPGLPKCTPTLPMLSPNEPDVVYFYMMSDIGFVSGHEKTKGGHMLGLNLRTKKVDTWSKCPPGRILWAVASFIATELCPASQESSNLRYLDDQENSQL